MITNRIRAFRLSKGESIRQLAAAVRMDPTNLSRLEAGRRGTSDPTKLRIADHFGVSVAEIFFQREGVPREHPPSGGGWRTARVPQFQEEPVANA